MGIQRLHDGLQAGLADANQLLGYKRWCRVSLLILVSTALHCHWLLEQPEGSKDVIFRHPRLDFLSNAVVWAAGFDVALLHVAIFDQGSPGFVLDDALRGWLCEAHRDVLQLLQVGGEFGPWPIV